MNLIVNIPSATRETSFVHAISAAGVMYTLTRNCSLGDLDNCGCDVSNNGKIGEDSLKQYQFYISWTCKTSSLNAFRVMTRHIFFFLRKSSDQVIFCVQAVVAGCGVAAVTTWISEKGFPNSTWTRRRQDRTPGLLSTCTTTQLGGW